MKVLLTTGQHIEVDPDTAEKMAGRAWRLEANGNVRHVYWDGENKRTRSLALVNLIFGDTPPGMVFRRLRDRLDFRRENLQLTPRGQHSTALSGLSDLERRGRALTHSTKKFKGVTPRGQRFIATIKQDGKARHLGTFDDQEAAAKAYDAALEALGYEPVNFPTP